MTTLLRDRGITPMLTRVLAGFLVLCCLMLWAQQTPKADAAEKHQREHCVTQCVPGR